jgi:alcohol dehydrogenase class IV
MWYFTSPEIVFGEDSLSRLDEIVGNRALIVTDKTVVSLGHADLVKQRLSSVGIDCLLFDGVEPEPSIETAKKGAEIAQKFAPDWIVGLGGGSVIDAAKAIWVSYERPDINPDEINPFDDLGLRRKAKMIAIATTSGTGSDANWGLVLTEPVEGRKLVLGCREVQPDIAVVDPIFAMSMPPQLTADTGMDVLTHAIEGYISKWRNDFSDGLCLKAMQLVFQYLPVAYHDGGNAEAREKMHNAASLAGLGFGNSMLAITHSAGHALGAVFHIPHGRAVGLFLPYIINFTAEVSAARYAEIVHFLRLGDSEDGNAVAVLPEAIRRLMRSINQPLTIKDLGIDYDSFEKQLTRMVSHADMDTFTVTSPRIPTSEEFEKVFRCAYTGKDVDF